MIYSELMEKIVAHVTREWHTLTLDNGDMLLANVSLLDKGVIELDLKKQSGPIKVEIGDNPVQDIEDALGYKLNMSNEDVKQFLYLLPQN